MHGCWPMADLEFIYCLVDSAEEDVEQLGIFRAAAGLRLNVLLEVGVAGGRAGVRGDAQAGCRA